MQRQKALDLNPNRTVGSTADWRNGGAWTAAMICELWEQWFLVWTTRNDAVHGYDQMTRLTQIKIRNQQKLRAIYDKRDEMEPRVRDELLYSRVEEHLEHHTHSSIQNWIAVYESTITQSIKRAAMRAIQGTRPIRSYFATGRPPGEDAAAHQPVINQGSTAEGELSRNGIKPSPVYL